MKTLHSDLFPETLLVSREGDRIYTTSLMVAEHFHKRHDHVVRNIENLLADLESDSPILGSQTDFSRLNFDLSEYKNQRGKTYPMYRLSHDGFALLAMGFTGKDALAWKVQFLAAFRDMERHLQAREARFAHALDQVRPFLRPVVEGTEQGLDRSAIAEPLGKSANAITYHRRKAREFGLLVA